MNRRAALLAALLVGTPSAAPAQDPGRFEIAWSREARAQLDSLFQDAARTDSISACVLGTVIDSAGAPLVVRAAGVTATNAGCGRPEAVVVLLLAAGSAATAGTSVTPEEMQAVLADAHPDFVAIAVVVSARPLRWGAGAWRRRTPGP